MYSRQFTQYILVLFFLVSSGFVLSNTEFTYNFIDGGIEVTGCAETCPSDLVIPEDIDGFAVIKIGNSAFSSSNLATVIFPSNLQTIEKIAFYDNNLQYINFPFNLSYIGDSAFSINNISSIHFTGDRPHFDSDNTNTNGEHFYLNFVNLITYCSGTTGWPGSSIKVMHRETYQTDYVTPQLDDDCDANIDEITWDFDQNGSVKALSDGLLFLRHAFGIRGDSLTSNVISPDSLLSYEEVISNVEGAYQIADIDNNDAVDPLTDGLILLRYAFGLRGDSLISGVISPDANRTTASDIEAYIESHMP